jgi:hypothetical protein
MSGIRSISPPPRIEDQALQKWLSIVREALMEADRQLPNQGARTGHVTRAELIDLGILGLDGRQNDKLFNPQAPGAAPFNNEARYGVPTSSPVGETVNITTITTDTLLTGTNATVLIDTSSNDVTATLPDSATHEGQIYRIKLVDNTNVGDIAPSGADTLDGTAAPFTLVRLEAYTVQSDGAGNWWIL